MSRKFATMDEDERRRFAMQNEGGTDAAPDELELSNPRESDTLNPLEENGDQAARDHGRRQP